MNSSPSWEYCPRLPAPGLSVNRWQSIAQRPSASSRAGAGRRGGGGAIDAEPALNRREVEALARTKPADVPDPPDILGRVSTMAARGLLGPDQPPIFPEAERGRTHARRLRRPMDVQVDVGHDSTLVL